MDSGNPPCVVCGCLGWKMSDTPCRRDEEGPYTDCALDRAGVCGCCNHDGRHCEKCKAAIIGEEE